MKTVWILNHYAGPPSVSGWFRHFNFAKHLAAAGYDVRVFSASALHNTEINLITDDSLYLEMDEEGIPCVVVRTRQYKGNGRARVLNMMDYYRNMMKVASRFPKPDVIIGSSVHPLACLAAIRLSKRFHCKNIVEIRDLWPETMVAYDILRKDALLTKALYQGEEWLYKKADALIFTMEGGNDYIADKGWDTAHGGPIDLEKVHHINNGVDLEAFDQNVKAHPVTNPALLGEDLFKVVYAGSIRKANGLELLVDAVAILQETQPNVHVFVFGDGDQRPALEKRCEQESIRNIQFCGKISKAEVPAVLCSADLNLLNYTFTKAARYGTSQNKLFEYLASGRPILSNLPGRYDIIEKYDAGRTIDCETPEQYADAIATFETMSRAAYDTMCHNARQAAEAYDFKVLTNKLINCIEGTTSA